MRPLVVLCLLAAPLVAQSERFLSIGVLAGGTVRPTLAATSSPQPVDCGACYVHYSEPAAKPLAFGGVVEMRFTRRLAVEADILYHRLSYSSVFELGSPSSGRTFAFSKTTARRWEIPVVVKLRLGRPFVVAGGALDWVDGVHTEADTGGRDLFGHVSFAHQSYDDEGQMTRGPRFGAVVGAGIELRLGPMRLAPQLRLTRWIKTRFSAEPDLRSNQTDATAIFTLMF